MHIHTLRSAALLAATLATVAACDQTPSNPSGPLDAGASSNAVVRSSGGPAAVDAVREDAQVYAATYGVDVDEAVRRLGIQASATALNARLSAEQPETFAGLSIEHQPEFRVVARFTRNGEQAVTGAVTDPALARVTVAERAAVPLAQLRRRTEAAYERLRARGIEGAASVNVRANRPEVHVLAGSAAEARAALGTDAAVVVVDRLPAREVQMWGGLPASTCTLGYSVQDAYGTTGISTAGHCGNSQSYSSYALSFMSEAWYGSHDVQWHTRSGDLFEPWIKVGSDVRVVTGTRTVSQQVAGEWVCKQGMTTGYTCGTISTTTYCWDAACTWVRVAGGTTNLSEPGDSGGPWFSGNTAYGTHVYGWGNDSGYMPIDYFAGIGVTVRTGTIPPPPPPLYAGINGPTQVPYGTWCYWSGWASGGVPPYGFAWISVGGLDDEWWLDNEYGVLTSTSGRSIEMHLTVRDAAGQSVEIMQLVDKSSSASC